MKFGINFFPSFRPEDSTTADYFAQCLRLAVRADELGYNSVKTVEHSFYDYGGHSTNPCIFLSAVAALTKRIRMMTGAVIPAFHHPAHLAGDLSMLDNMSRGRLDAGMGRAFLPKEFEVYGVPLHESRPRFEEAIGAIKRLWTEDSVTHKGQYWQFDEVHLMPRPVQQPHPPVWIPGGGSVETWQWCAEMDYVYAYLSYYGYKDGKATMDGFWREMGRLGKDRNPNRAAFLQFVGVAETREKALELYREPAEYFYGRCLHVDPAWASPPGYMTEGTMRAGMTSQVGRAAANSARSKMRATEMKDIVDLGYVIIGSPDEVVEQLTEVATELNVAHLMLLLQYGNMGKELAKYNTKLFAEKVMPRLQPLFAEWEDRWWPQPMEPAQRAEIPAFKPGLAAE